AGRDRHRPAAGLPPGRRDHRRGDLRVAGARPARLPGRAGARLPGAAGSRPAVRGDLPARQLPRGPPLRLARPPDHVLVSVAVAPQQPLVAEHRPRWREVLGVLLRNPLAVAAIVFLLLLLAAAVFGDALAPHDPTAASVRDRLQPPSTAHPFGTDE